MKSNSIHAALFISMFFVTYCSGKPSGSQRGGLRGGATVEEKSESSESIEADQDLALNGVVGSSSCKKESTQFGNSDGGCLNKATGLVLHYAYKPMNFAEAIAYCKNYRGGSYGDWTLFDFPLYKKTENNYLAIPYDINTNQLSRAPGFKAEDYLLYDLSSSVKSFWIYGSGANTRSGRAAITTVATLGGTLPFGKDETALYGAICQRQGRPTPAVAKDFDRTNQYVTGVLKIRGGVYTIESYRSLGVAISSADGSNVVNLPKFLKLAPVASAEVLNAQRKNSDLMKLVGRTVFIVGDVSIPNLSMGNIKRVVEIPSKSGGCLFESARYQSLNEGCAAMDGSGLVYYTQNSTFVKGGLYTETRPSFEGPRQRGQQINLQNPVQGPISTGFKGAATGFNRDPDVVVSSCPLLGGGYRVLTKAEAITLANSGSHWNEIMGDPLYAGTSVGALRIWVKDPGSSTPEAFDLKARDSKTTDIGARTLCIKKDASVKLMNGALVESPSNEPLLTFAGSYIAPISFSNTEIFSAKYSDERARNVQILAAVRIQSFGSTVNAMGGVAARLTKEGDGYFGELSYSVEKGRYFLSIKKRVKGVVTTLRELGLKDPLGARTFFNATGGQSPDIYSDADLLFTVQGTSLSLEMSVNRRRAACGKVKIDVEDSSIAEPGEVGVRFLNGENIKIAAGAAQYAASIGNFRAINMDDTAFRLSLDEISNGDLIMSSPEGGLDKACAQTLTVLSDSVGGGSPNLPERKIAEIDVSAMMNPEAAASANSAAGGSKSSSESSCTLQQDVCTNFPTNTGSFEDSLNEANVKKDNCFARAKSLAIECNNPAGKSTKATFRDASGVESSSTYTVPFASLCAIKQTVCPAYPSYVGSFLDTFNGADKSQAACFQRASDYSIWCKNPTGTPTTAVFRAADGSETQTVFKAPARSSCTIGQSYCTLYPQFATTFLDDWNGSADYEQACFNRASEYAYYCQNPPGSTTLATFTTAAAKKTYFTFRLPSPSQCEIYQSSCKNNPALIGKFLDNYNNSANNQTVCLSRAKDYAVYCGNPRFTSTTATFTDTNGAQRNSYYTVP